MNSTRVRWVVVVSFAFCIVFVSSSTRGSGGTISSQPATLAPPPLAFIYALVIDPHNSNTIWAALETGSSLYRTDDGGRTWRPITVWPEQQQAIGAIAIDQSGNLYVGARYAAQLWRSSDDGQTWRRLTRWPRSVVPVGMHRARPAVVSKLVVDPSRTGTAYAVSENTVFRTTDAGRTWMRASRGLPAGEPLYPWRGGHLVTDRSDPAVLYMVTHRRGVYRTPNRGNWWFSTSHKCGRACLARAYPRYGDYTVLGIDANRPRRLYAGLPFAIYRSTDRGNRWRRVLDIDRGFGGDLVVATDGTVYANGILGRGPAGALSVARSRDGGSTWTHTLRFKRHPPGMAYFAPGPLAADPRNPSIVLAAIGAGDSGGGPVCVRLLKTSNRGRSWQAVDAGLVPLGGRCPLQ